MAFLRIVSPEQFKVLRDYFKEVGYTEGSIRRRFNVEPDKALNLLNYCVNPPPDPKVVTGLDAVTHLFLSGEMLDNTQATALLPPLVWEALTQSQLVLPEGENDATRCFASVALFPVQDIFLAADRWTNVDHTLHSPVPDDIVYPVMTKTGADYLQYTSFAPCEDFLEVCAGSAPAALLAAKTSQRVWAADITDRSVGFAEFNAALNGISNVSVVRGDLFEPVSGLKFDRIAAHPPYLPTLKQGKIFAAGGELGEDLQKRIVAELPERLKPGGRFYCRTLGIDRAGCPFEQTVRQWLGEKQGEFDVAAFELESLSPIQFALENALSRAGDRASALQWERLFEERGVKELLAVVLVIQQVAERRSPFTLRRAAPAGTSAALLEWAMRWEVERHRSDILQELLQAKPVAVEGVEVSARQIFKEGELKDGEFRMAIKRPFKVDCRVQPWMSLLLPECDGKRTVSEVLEFAKKKEWIHPETPPLEFSAVVGMFIGLGFLSAETFKWPEAEG